MRINLAMGEWYAGGGGAGERHLLAGRAPATPASSIVEFVGM
jgi:hypothetical protein